MHKLRTSLELDKNLIDEAMELSQVKTKKGVIEYALLEFVEKRRKKDLREIQGHIEFAEGYDYKAMRTGRVVDCESLD